MKNKLLKYSGIVVIAFALCGNIQWTLSDYGQTNMSATSQIMATGTSTTATTAGWLGDFWDWVTGKEPEKKFKKEYNKVTMSKLVTRVVEGKVSGGVAGGAGGIGGSGSVKQTESYILILYQNLCKQGTVLSSCEHSWDEYAM